MDNYVNFHYWLCRGRHGKLVRKYIKDNDLSEEELSKIYLNIKLSCGGS